MKDKVRNLVILHIMFMIFSLGAVASKTAANSEFLSLRFCFFYGLVLGGLFIYAIVWQQMLKRLPLVTAYANKAVTVVWGIIWGFVFFNEAVTVRKIIGAVIVIIGVCIVVTADKDSAGSTDDAVIADVADAAQNADKTENTEGAPI